MGGIASILSVLNGGDHVSPERPYLIPLNLSDDSPSMSEKRYFQYWPDVINDSKQNNWETKAIPGLSHPLYQWTSGGPREISFTAIFSRDVQLSDQDKFILSGSVQQTSSSLNQSRNVDIPSAVAWLRSFIYPGYNTGSSFFGVSIVNGYTKPPRKLILGLPGMRMGYAPSTHDRDELVCIMTQCEVVYEGFFSDGTPRFARVSLQFAETIQNNNRINTQDAFAIRQTADVGYNLKTSPSDKKR